MNKIFINILMSCSFLTLLSQVKQEPPNYSFPVSIISAPQLSSLELNVVDSIKVTAIVFLRFGYKNDTIKIIDVIYPMIAVKVGSKRQEPIDLITLNNTSKTQFSIREYVDSIINNNIDKFKFSVNSNAFIYHTKNKIDIITSYPFRFEIIPKY